MGNRRIDTPWTRLENAGSQAGRDPEEVGLLFQAGQLKISGPLLADLKMVAKLQGIEPAALALMLLEYVIDKFDEGKLTIVDPSA